MTHRIRPHFRFIAVISAFLCAPLAAAAPPIDLSGIWAARYTVPGTSNQFATQLVSIQTFRDIIIATKLTGNICIPSGQITFKGRYDAATFPAQVQVAGVNFTNPHFLPTTIQVLDAAHLRVGNLSFTRLARPAAPPKLTPAQQAQIDRQEKLEGQLLFGAFMAYLQTPSDSASGSSADAQQQVDPTELDNRIQQQIDEDDAENAEAEAQSPMNNP